MLRPDGFKHSRACWDDHHRAGLAFRCACVHIAGAAGGTDLAGALRTLGRSRPDGTAEPHLVRVLHRRSPRGRAGSRAPSCLSSWGQAAVDAPAAVVCSKTTLCCPARAVTRLHLAEVPRPSHWVRPSAAWVPGEAACWCDQAPILRAAKTPTAPVSCEVDGLWLQGGDGAGPPSEGCPLGTFASLSGPGG